MGISAMGWGLIIFIALFVCIGIGMVAFVKGSGKRYIVCGKSLPFFFVGTMLMAQAVDANTSLGAASLAYEIGFWEGFTIPLGLATCLLLTALFYAKKLNKMNLLTLPDYYFRRYGSSMELITGLAMALSFMILVAGNFSGSAWILTIIFDMDYLTALIVISVLIFVYTIAGGLFSCAATDIVQLYPAIIGFVGCFVYLLASHGWDYFAEVVPPGYFDIAGMTSMERGSLLNWANIVALGLGDVVALDFMERIYSARTGRTAQIACFYAAFWTVCTGFVCTMIGVMGMKLYPEIADSRMVLPTIALEQVPYILGLLMVGGVIGAGASTANGGILGISTTFGRNIFQKNIMRWVRASRGEKLVVHHSEEERKKADARLLWISRAMAVPALAGAIWIAYVKPEPGTLLALAFDVVLAGCFVPLTLGLYWKKANEVGALVGMIVGSVARVVMIYTTPEHLAGMETLVAPLFSLIMIPVSLMTQASCPSKHHVNDEVPDDAEVLAGVC